MLLLVGGGCPCTKAGPGGDGRSGRWRVVTLGKRKADMETAGFGVDIVQ